MHLLDPSYVVFATAVVVLATAITGLVRELLQKKSGIPSSSIQKKHKSVPLERFKKKENRLTSGSGVLEALAEMKVSVLCLTGVDDDHISPSNLNRALKKNLSC
jgi:hypothetical protein